MLNLMRKVHDGELKELIKDGRVIFFKKYDLIISSYFLFKQRQFKLRT